MFSGDVEEYLPPEKGRKHVLHVVRKLLFYEPKGKKTDIGTALRYLMRVVKRRAIVFVLSDFIAPDFSREIAMAARKFDVIALKLGDEREKQLPPGRLLRVWDQEEGAERVIDLSRRGAREAFSRLASEREGRLMALFRRSGVDVVRITTGEDYIKPLSLFFRARARRR